MTGWRVLLSNHYHLMIETPAPNLVGMQRLQNTVTRRFNVRHRAWGRFFGDHCKAVAVDGRAPYYYETLLETCGRERRAGGTPNSLKSNESR